MKWSSGENRLCDVICSSSTVWSQRAKLQEAEGQQQNGGGGGGGGPAEPESAWLKACADPRLSVHDRQTAADMKGDFKTPTYVHTCGDPHFDETHLEVI